MINSIKDVCEQFWRLEEQYGLLDYELDGVKFWQVARMSFYYDLAKKTGVLAEPHPEVQISLIEKCQNYWKALFVKNPFFDFSQREVLIIDHVRKVSVDNEYVDIYTKYLIDDLLAEKVNLEVYEPPNFGHHLTKPQSFRKYLDVIHLFYQHYNSLIPVRVSSSQRSFLETIQTDIERSFGIPYDFIQAAVDKVRNFKAKYWFYKKLFKLKKPKKVFILVSYGNVPCIRAAKELGIEVIELQHGTFSDYHLGYSYPKRNEPLDCFPDQFWVWNEFWKRLCVLPINEQAIKIYPFRYQEIQKEKYKNVAKNVRQMIVISQGALGEKIAQAVLQANDRLKEFRIIYKLHPSEFKIWRQYPSLVQLSQQQNVTIVDNTDISLYQLLAESKYLVGVFSTVIYEAMEFDCEIFLLDLPGVEYMKKLLQIQKAKMFDLQNLAEAIQNTRR